MRNLFRDRSRLQSIEKIYNAGSQNTIIGKYYNISTWGDYRQRLYFYEQNSLEQLIDVDKINLTVESYTIKNYIVFTNAFIEIGKYGYTY